MVIKLLILQVFISISLQQKTALHVAAAAGFKEIVKYLVSKQADVSIKDKAGVSIWDYTT